MNKSTNQANKQPNNKTSLTSEYLSDYHGFTRHSLPLVTPLDRKHVTKNVTRTSFLGTLASAIHLFIRHEACGIFPINTFLAENRMQVRIDMTILSKAFEDRQGLR